jgi:hypothetical protein
MKSVGVELTDVTTARLLLDNILSFHGGCVSKNGRAFIITGLPDTGKTFTTMKLLENSFFDFLSEDILLIDNDFNAYAIPFTQTVEKRKKLSPFEKLKGKIYESVFKNNYVKSDILEVLPDVQKRIVPKSKIDTVFFLTRGDSGVKILGESEREKITRKLIQLNHLEFTYWRNEMILSYLFFNSDMKITELLEKEDYLISNLVKNVNLVELSAPSAPEYYPLLMDYLG